MKQKNPNYKKELEKFKLDSNVVLKILIEKEIDHAWISSNQPREVFEKIWRGKIFWDFSYVYDENNNVINPYRAYKSWRSLFWVFAPSFIFLIISSITLPIVFSIISPIAKDINSILIYDVALPIGSIIIFSLLILWLLHIVIKYKKGWYKILNEHNIHVPCKYLRNNHEN